MVSVTSIAGFLLDNILKSALIAIVIPIVGWRIKRHISRHREIESLLREIQFACKGDTHSDDDDRRQFQEEAAELGEELKSRLRSTPIKNQNVREKSQTVVKTCEEISQSWVINSTTTDIDTTGTHAFSRDSQQFRENTEQLANVAEGLQSEVRKSLVFGPLYNFLT